MEQPAKALSLTPRTTSARRTTSRRSSRRKSLPHVDPAVLERLDPELIPFMHRTKESRYEMEDPVVARDGHTYEREAIEAYIQEHGKSPISGEPLDLDSLIENRAVWQQIESYHDAAERAEQFEEHATDGADHPSLAQTLTEADELAARELFDESADVYNHIVRGLQAQLSASSDTESRAALTDQIIIIKQRLAGVVANKQQSRILAVPLITPGSASTDTGGVESPPFSGNSGHSSQGGQLDLASLDRQRTMTSDYEDTGPPMKGGVPTDVPPGPDGIQELLTECSKHNFESESEEDPVKGKSIWLKYNAGRRRGQWREVWPFNDSVTPPWQANSVGIQPYFRGMEADHIDIHHGRTTKYMLHLVLEISAKLPPDWNDSPLSMGTCSAATDDGDWMDRPIVSSPRGSQGSLHALAGWREPEPEPEVGLGGMGELGLEPMLPREHSESPPLARALMRGSARDLLKHHDVPDRVADMLEEEDIHTPQTLVDLDDSMVEALGLKLGERIKLKQAINFAKAARADHRDASPAPPLSPGIFRTGSDQDLKRLAGEPDVDAPAVAAADARMAEAYRGFQKASDIGEVSDIVVKEYLSKGTSGTVCKAEWRGMDVAVKKFYYVDEPELISSFENEVFFMREMHHANLIRFFAAQCKPPDLCIVMELMLGSLSDLLYGKLSKGAEKSITDKRQLSIIKGIGSGMLFLHEHGVCHRDLKSANVLFNRHLDVKLCDFAFSKFKQQASMSARFETSVGTPAWMAPEVLRGDEYTLLADVYSFGVIVWEVVCRRAPFHDLNRFQIIFQVGTQGGKLDFPEGTAAVWEEIGQACWREKPAGAKSRRPTFRQIVDVLSTTQDQMKAGVALGDGAGMDAWEDAERVREEEHAKYDDRATGTIPIDLPALHAGITESLEGEADEDSEEEVTAADPDAPHGVGTLLVRVQPRQRAASSPMLLAVSHSDPGPGGAGPLARDARPTTPVALPPISFAEAASIAVESNGNGS